MKLKIKRKAKAKPLENAETTSKVELQELGQAFSKRRNDEKRKFIENTDSEFWFCVGFQNRKQKNEFLEKTGLIKIGDKFLDGQKVADILKIKITKVVGTPSYKHSKRWESLT